MSFLTISRFFGCHTLDSPHAVNDPVPGPQLSKEQSDPIPKPVLSQTALKERCIKKMKESSTAVLLSVAQIFLSSICVYVLRGTQPYIARAFEIFLGREGKVKQSIIISIYVILKLAAIYTDKSNHNQDLKISVSATIDKRKKFLKEFRIGLMKAPKLLVKSLYTAWISTFLFKSLSIKNHVDTRYKELLNKITLFEIGLKYPFQEELFCREFVQGSLISIMKLLNEAGIHVYKHQIFREDTINISARIVSATTFGVLHASQSLVQAAHALYTAYHDITKIYETRGFFASFVHHSTGNLLKFSIYSGGKALFAQIIRNIEKEIERTNFPIRELEQLKKEIERL